MLPKRLASHPIRMRKDLSSGRDVLGHTNDHVLSGLCTAPLRKSSRWQHHRVLPNRTPTHANNRRINHIRMLEAIPSGRDVLGRPHVHVLG